MTSSDTESLKPRSSVGHRADSAVDRDVADLGSLAPADDSNRALEAGREANGEQLLGVGAFGAAVALGRAKLHVERPVGLTPWPSARPPVTVASAV